MTEIINAETGEVIDVMNAAEAERITLRISLKLGTLADTYESVMPLLRDAITRRAHEALGYASAGAYLSDRFGESLSRLGVELRREVVRELTAAEISTRAIASVFGVDHSQIVRDRQVVHSAPPEADAAAPDGPEPLRIVGNDGKTYTRAEPKPVPEPTGTREAALQNYRERRRPLAEGFRDASLDLAKLITRLENLAADDRLPKNRDEVARYANDLIRAKDALERVINQMSQQKGTAA